MSILSRFAKVKVSEPEDVRPSLDDCEHFELAPRWDSATDMGKPDKITSYTCSTCKKDFTPDEVRSLRAS